MGYPNVPLGTTEWQRKIAQGLNYLLNKLTFFQFVVEDQPTAGEQILLTQFPVEMPLIARQCFGVADTAPTNDAVFTVLIGGSSAGTFTFAAGSTVATVSLTSSSIPAFTDFEIVAPTPQDPTLADVTLTLASKL